MHKFKLPELAQNIHHFALYVVAEQNNLAVVTHKNLAATV